MARNRDRQFSESENLKFHLDREFAQVEDRMPRWASEQQEQGRRSYWAERDDQGAATDAPKSPAVHKASSAEEGPASWRPPVRKTEEQSAWQASADEYSSWMTGDDEQDIPRRASSGQAPATEGLPRSGKHQLEAAEMLDWEDEPKRPARNWAVDRSSQNAEEESWAKEEDPLYPDEDFSRPPKAQPPRPPHAPGKPTASKGDGKKGKNRSDDESSFLRKMLIAGICVFLFLMVTLMVVSNFVDHPMLALPRKWVTQIVTPVQNFFSDITGSVEDYLRRLKVRGNIEDAYQQALDRIDELETDLARYNEYVYENQQLQALLSEHNDENHRQFNPIGATVIGNDGGNYFSTLTLNVGANDGVGEYMAVVSSGGLVGVTYNVEDNKCQVRCIINSDSTVAALVNSSRDQGSVKGTLGANGEAMCRMYYLPDNSLPRPGDMVSTSGVGLEFPKGIPIGYIRESTRGMDDNKSYVVLDPIVDFQHLEYVTVYRYKPAYAESAQIREDNMQLALQAAPTIRPVPTFSLGGVSDFMFSSASPAPAQAQESPAPSTSPTPGPIQSPTPDPNATARPGNLEYIPALPDGVTPSPSPRPSPTPTPTPAPTQNPGGMTMEDEE